MFNFAFEGKLKPAAAQEDMIVATAEDVNGSNNPTQCSDGAAVIMKSGALKGLVSAFAMRMAAKGVPSEEITERVTAFINSAAVAGDLERSSANWIKDSDWYRQLEYTSMVSVGSSECMWTYIRDLRDYALGCQSYAAECSRDARAKMTEEERTILDNYDKCSKAYWEAREIREAYYAKKAKLVVRDLLVKYTDVLSKLDQELFDYLCQHYEIRTDTSASEGVPAPVL